MKDGRTAVEPDRPADILDGHLVAAQLVGDQAQKVQRIGLIGLPGQNLPVHLLRLGQATGLVKLHGKRQGFGKRGHGRRGSR